jgi:hypothetical protein
LKITKTEVIRAAQREVDSDKKEALKLLLEKAIYYYARVIKVFSIIEMVTCSLLKVPAVLLMRRVLAIAKCT